MSLTTPRKRVAQSFMRAIVERTGYPVLRFGTFVSLFFLVAFLAEVHRPGIASSTAEAGLGVMVFVLGQLLRYVSASRS